MAKDKRNSNRGRAKPQMVHKPLIKPGHRASKPVGALSLPPAFARSDAALSSTGTPATPKARTIDPTALKLVEGLITNLPNAINPDYTYGEILSHAMRLGLELSPEKTDLIETNLQLAHSNAVKRLLEQLPTSDHPDATKRQILEGAGNLARKVGEEKAIELLGMPRSTFEAQLNQKYEAARACLAEIKLKGEIQAAVRMFNQLIRSNDVATNRAALERALDNLGEFQIRAFPVGVETREEMDLRIDQACGEAETHLLWERKRLLRSTINEKVRNFGGSERTYLRPQLSDPSPDAILKEIQDAVVEHLDGDYSNLGREFSWHTIPAEQVVADLDVRHTEAVHERADRILEAREIKKTYPDGFYPVLDDIRVLVSRGFSAERYIQAYKTNVGRGFGNLDDGKGALLSELQHTEQENAALRLAVVAEYYAFAGEKHGVTLGKAVAAMQALGGIDAFEPMLDRLKIRPDEWARFKDVAAKAMESANEAPQEAPPVIPNEEQEELEFPEPTLDLRSYVKQLREGLDSSPSFADAQSILEETHDFAGVQEAEVALPLLYRDRIQDLLSTDKFLDFAAMIEHLGAVSIRVGDKAPTLTATLSVYADILTDRMNRIIEGPMRDTSHDADSAVFLEPELT